MSFLGIGEQNNVKPTFEKVGAGDKKSKEQFHTEKQQEASESLSQESEGKRGRGRPKGSTNKGQASTPPPSTVDATLFINGTKIILNGLSNVASKIIKKKAEKVVDELEAKEYGEDARIIEEELEMTATQLGALAAQSQFLAMYAPYLLAIGGLASWGVRLAAINSSLDKLIDEMKKSAGKSPSV